MVNCLFMDNLRLDNLNRVNQMFTICHVKKNIESVDNNLLLFTDKIIIFSPIQFLSHGISMESKG